MRPFVALLAVAVAVGLFPPLVKPPSPGGPLPPTRSWPMHACFAPGTDPAVVARFTQRGLPDSGDGPQAFSAGVRWTSTASGGAVGNGTPVTVTYSFVPDGVVSINDPDFGQPSIANDLHQRLNAELGSAAVWKQIYRDCFDAWSTHTGITFVEEPADDGAALPLSPGVLGVRGDIRIACFNIDGPSSVLAFNYLPNLGDQFLDSSEDWGDPFGDFRFFRNTIMHELGHGIGLFHVWPLDSSKLMEPFLNIGFAGPQDDDIRGGTFFYGDGREANASPAAADDLPAFADGLMVNHLSLHNPDDVDWFFLPAAAGARIAVSAEPVGSAYSVGVDQNSTAPIDTRRILPLALEVYDEAGDVLLRGATATVAGDTAAAPGVEVPAGTAGVLLKVYSVADAPASPQRYRLQFLEQDSDLFTLAIDTFGGNGALVSVNPADAFGRTQIALPGSLLYAASTPVTLTAPGTFGGLDFDRWILDGVSQAEGVATLNLTITADTSLQANYGLELAVNVSGVNKIVPGEVAMLTAVAAGGAWPYTYEWTPATGLDDPQAATVRATPAETTQYRVTVIDRDGKVGVGGITVFALEPLIADAGADRFAIIGSLASLQAVASGGEPPYDFLWSPQVNPGNPESTSYTPRADQTRTYTLTVQDVRGRSASDSVKVTAVGPVAAGLASEEWIERGESFTIRPRVTGGAPPFEYVWFAGGRKLEHSGDELTVTPSATTGYLAQITDGLGLETSAAIIVRVAEPLAVAIEASNVKPQLGASVMLKALVTGGVPPYTFAWSPAGEQPADGATLTAVPTEDQEFALRVNDARERSAEATVRITPVVPRPAVEAPDNGNDNEPSNDNTDDDPAGPVAAPGLCSGAGFSTLLLLSGSLVALRRRERCAR